MRSTSFILLLTAAFALLTLFPALAADDPTIPKAEKQKINKAMHQYVSTIATKGLLPIFHPKSRNVIHLRLKKVHRGVFRKGPYFASCADFLGPKGTRFDVDFLVKKNQKGHYRVVLALIHKKNGKKWPYGVK